MKQRTKEEFENNNYMEGDVLTLIKESLKQQALKEYKDYLGTIERKTGLTKAELEEYDLDTRVIRAVLVYIIYFPAPDGFWIELYLSSREGNVLQTAVNLTARALEETNSENEKRFFFRGNAHPIGFSARA